MKQTFFRTPGETWYAKQGVMIEPFKWGTWGQCVRSDALRYNTTLYFDYKWSSAILLVLMLRGVVIGSDKYGENARPEIVLLYYIVR
jgi:hypothetical protein